MLGLSFPIQKQVLANWFEFLTFRGTWMLTYGIIILQKDTKWTMDIGLSTIRMGNKAIRY